MDPSDPLADGGLVRRPARKPSFFPRILESILAAGKDMLDRGSRGQRPLDALSEACRALLTQRGDASGLALAREVAIGYEALPAEERRAFFELLVDEFAIEPDAVVARAEAYRQSRSFEALQALRQALEAPRRELFRRINMVPGGTRTMVRMREALLELLAGDASFLPLETDLRELLVSWFNRGFLVLEEIDWDSPASVLERIIEYEAVHEINGWDDLRNRLQSDRRCFAFFHLAIPDDPLIFVQVALTDGIATAVEPLLTTEREVSDPRHADTAMFYSISNCHRGLSGISFGHFLIKQVVEELRRDLENIRQFATLSPVPGFRRWAQRNRPEELPEPLDADLRAVQAGLNGPDSRPERERLERHRDALLRLCAHYLLEVKRSPGDQPLDGVARFHLANGASIAQIDWAADGSDAGLGRSYGIMVNYLYTLKDIEKNHEAYFRDAQIAASASVRRLAKGR